MNITKVKLGDIRFYNNWFSYLPISRYKKKSRYPWEKLEKKIADNGYELFKPIEVSKDLILLDGHHRLKVLSEKYTDDKEIDVKIKKFKYIWFLIAKKIGLIIILLGALIYLPIKFTIKGFKYLISIFKKFVLDQ